VVHGRPPTARSARDLALAVALSLASLGLALLCLRHALAAYEASVDPVAALRWDSAEPDALSTLAARRSEAAATPRDHAAAVDYARRALRAAPLDAQALRVLAIEAEGRGEAEGAARLMALAGERTQRDTLTQLWLFAHAALGHDPSGASVHADVILRRKPELAPLLFPAMERTLGEPGAEAAYVARLAGRPEWRRAFLSDLARGADIGAARAVYAGLAATRAPPTGEELGYLLARLVADGDYRGARALWGRPGAALYDRRFQGLGGPPPFNWRLTDDHAAVAELARTPDDGPALHVQSPAESTTGLAEQLLVLPPGAYHLTGEVLVESGPAANAFSWSVTCLPGGDPLGADAEGASDPAAWKAFAIDIQVPARGCGAQWLRLSGLAHEGFEMGSAWYRDMRLMGPLRGATGTPQPPR
jgi:hypothetical protein